MTSNKATVNVNSRDVECIKKAKVRALKVYLKSSSWREVGTKYGINHAYIWQLVYRNRVPVDPMIRKRLGLPKVLPSERIPRAKKILPKVGEAGWEDLYFKKVKKIRN